MPIAPFTPQEPRLRWSFPTTKLGVLAGGIGLLSVAVALVAHQIGLNFPVVAKYAYQFQGYATYSAVGLFLVALLALIMHIWLPRRWAIYFYVRKALYAHRFGNPLGLKKGAKLPRLQVKKIGEDYLLTIYTASVTIEKIAAAQSAISSAFRGRLRHYAATKPDADIASSYLRFTISDVVKDRSITVTSTADLLMHRQVTRLAIQSDIYLDLTSSGSMLLAGKTRSGKTTGAIALLLQILSHGADAHGSRVVIVDPKQAELSRLPGVLTLDEAGNPDPIVQGVLDFQKHIATRQKVLNELSEQTGRAMKWWDAEMHPSVLFLDEFVALRSMLPARLTKDMTGYSREQFDSALRKILTMGASAGCFVMLSIAQANAEQLPTMLRDAFSTRILFRPTLDEGALMWDRAALTALPPRIYAPGEAWFSSSDGLHDQVTTVRFPRPSPEFEEYGELARLLRAYGSA